MNYKSDKTKVYDVIEEERKDESPIKRIDKFSVDEISAVIDKYYEDVQKSRTPALIDVTDLKDYIKKNI